MLNQTSYDEGAGPASVLMPPHLLGRPAANKTNYVLDVHRSSLPSAAAGKVGRQQPAVDARADNNRLRHKQDRRQ